MITLVFPVCGKSFCSFLLGISFLLVALLSTTVAMAQTQQQPFRSASTFMNGQEAVVTFLRTRPAVFYAATATPIPFAHQCLPEAIDQQSPPLFLFGVCANGVAMYSFDPTSGAVAEIAPDSPYTASTTGNSVYAVAEATGQYVYLIKITEPDVNGDSQFILDQFQIVRGAAPALIPINSQRLPYLGQMGGIYPDANSHGIAIYTTVGEPDAAPPTQTPTLFLITFDPDGCRQHSCGRHRLPGILCEHSGGQPARGFDCRGQQFGQFRFGTHFFRRCDGPVPLHHHI